MLAEERLRTILEILEVRKAVSVAQLCQQTGASEATIRRDLNELSRQGKINKVHGGAMLPEGEFESQEQDVHTKEGIQVEQKERSPAMRQSRYAMTILFLSTREPRH